MQGQNNLKRLRKAQGFSIMELATITGVSTARIVGVERYNLYPGPSVRARLSKALRISESVIWHDLENEGSDGKSD